MSSMEELEGKEVFAARQISKASTTFGSVLTVLGIFAVLTPLFTGIAATLMVGALLLAAGCAEVIFAIRAQSLGKGVLRFLFGGLGVLAALVIFATPLASLGTLTIVLGVFFLAAGLTDLTLAWKLRQEEGWAWLLFSGTVSLAVAVFVIAQWPLSGTWAVGLYIGIRMLMHGWVLMAVGRTSQEALTVLQDTRIEMLERHGRERARALQETQAILADHTAMLLALDNELRKKISASEVDPAIAELNRDLGEARKRLQDAISATKDTWDKTQDEANAAFRELMRKAEETTGRLKGELGIK